jgi:hypothetical protein
MGAKHGKRGAGHNKKMVAAIDCKSHTGGILLRLGYSKGGGKKGW